MDTPLLNRKKCLPCTGEFTVPTENEIAGYMEQLPDWEVQNRRLKKTFRFKNFVRLMEFVNLMASIAETEGHHPDFGVHYNVLDVTIWTHAANDLTESDFILAAKIDTARR